MFHFLLEHGWSSLVAQTVKNLPAVRETRDQSLGWEDLLEKGMATHSSILAWTILWTEEPGKLQSMSLQRVRHDWSDLAHTARGCFNVLRQFLLFDKVNQLYIRTCPLFSEFPSRLVATEPRGEFSALYSRFLSFFYYYYFLFVVDFVIHWNETAMGLHEIPLTIPDATRQRRRF